MKLNRRAMLSKSIHNGRGESMEGTNTLETLLTSIGTVVTQMFTWLGNVVDIIVEKPILFLGFAVGITFAIVRLVKRFV